MTDDIKNKVTLASWVSGASAFALLALSNFRCHHLLWLVALALLVAGPAWFLIERVKSAIVIALAGLFLIISVAISGSGGVFVMITYGPASVFRFVVVVMLLALMYSGVVLDFKATRLARVTFINAVHLGVLHFLLIFFNFGLLHWVIVTFISAFQLVFAACFISRKYLQVEKLLLIYEEIILKPEEEKILKPTVNLIRRVAVRCRTRLNGPMAQFRECNFSQKLCTGYAYSVFVLGLICGTALIILACGANGKSDLIQELIVAAIVQLVGCFIWERFILDQISCAIKLRGQQIVAGTAPAYLCFVSFLCWLMSVVGVVAVISVAVSDSPFDWISHWVVSLVDIQTLISVATVMMSCSRSSSSAAESAIKLAVIVSLCVTIWHLMGSSLVALVIRNNIARVRSLGNAGDNKAEA